MTKVRDPDAPLTDLQRRIIVEWCEATGTPRPHPDVFRCMTRQQAYDLSSDLQDLLRLRE